MKVVAYLRCSTIEQADSGAGIAAQGVALQCEADRRGWDVVAWIEDAGHSAKSMRRPGLSAALGMLKAGDADALAVSKMDRLSRSLADFCRLIEQAQREGWALITLDSPADLTTPSGEALASMLVVFSQLERRLIGQRTRDALAVKRLQGVKLGRPRAVPTEIVHRIRTDHAAGMSQSAIARTLNSEGVATAHGGVKWYPATVRKVVLQG